ncbi:cyclic GMP-AMP synthase-like [Heptranchias perlo]|uniref:cyclic GMP-AMP synthase-like n=1 Tax=Heptranchias perlo TaxID=212740 RepID=UPI00355AC180
MLIEDHRTSRILASDRVMSERRRRGPGPGPSPANPSSAAPPPATGPGGKPKDYPGKGSKQRSGASSCPPVESINSRNGSTDIGGKSSAKHNDASERKIGTSRTGGVTSRDKTGTNRDKTGTSRDKTGTNRDKTGTSRDKTGTSRTGGVTSRDKTGTNRDKTGTSRTVSETSRDKTGSNRDKTDISRDKTGTSRTVSETSRDKTGSNRNKTGTSRTGGDTSRDKTDISRDKTGISRTVSDTNRDKTGTNRDKTGTSRDKTGTSRTGGDTSRDKTGTSSERDRNMYKLLKSVVESLRLRSAEKGRAARRVNEVVDHLLSHIRKDSGGCFAAIKKLSSGSYYENVKISEPNEFDIMITIPVKRIEFMEVDSEGAFYQVAFKRNPGGNPLEQFVDNGTLSAEQMLCHLRKLIKEAAKTLTEFQIKLERKKPGSPAVTLLITGEDHVFISLDMVLALEVHSQSWPISTNEGLKIEDWLGKKVRRDFRNEPFYLVPKQPLDATQGTRSQSHKEMWRISFSHIEKKMLLNHGSLKTCCENGSPRCCRKSCLKLLKHLIQKLKEKNPRPLSRVCSYHAKTTLLHACVKRPKDETWSFENLDICFLQLLDDFIDHLQRANLSHFFVPTYNLFNPSLFDSRSREVLLQLIESERNKGFPIFSNSI